MQEALSPSYHVYCVHAKEKTAQEKAKSGATAYDRDHLREEKAEVGNNAPAKRKTAKSEE